jgi:RimJ/RimL family protein N-acetyltransferase
LNQTHDDLLGSLQLQEDVWEFIGTLPVPTEKEAGHLFAVMEGQVSLGFAGLVQSEAAGGKDFELLCAIRSEAQLRGAAKHACELVLKWAFTVAKLERVIACIDDDNAAARAIAGKIGMTPLGSQPPQRTVYVKYAPHR